MSGIIQRFSGPENQHRLIDEISRQAIVQGNRSLAREIVSEIELVELDLGTRFVTQGEAEDDLYFVLSGRVSVEINGREIAIRGAGEHVGEMALLDPTAPRLASLTTIENAVLGKITEAKFTPIATRNPNLWRLLARLLGDRLRQRSRYIEQKNPRPVVFIGSSSEALATAERVKTEIEGPDCLVRIWTGNVFVASSFAIVDLEEQVRTSDFAILLLTADDMVLSRDVIEHAPRDNVIFELGLFMGAITHSRTFVLSPKGTEIKIPSDLLGLNLLLYDLNAEPGSYSGLNAMTTEIRRIIGTLGTK